MQNPDDQWHAGADASRVAALTNEQRRELERRLAEHRANPDSAIPWDEARALLRDRFGI